MMTTGFATDDVEQEFAVGAVRYLRNAGLGPAEIRASLIDELGLDAADAERLAEAAA